MYIYFKSYFQIFCHARIPKYISISAKDYSPNWLEEVFCY